MKELAKVFKALSDETRLRTLSVLTEKECCVCEVMQALEISQTRASRNLKLINDAGFLKVRTDGLYTLYSLRDTGDGFHAELLGAVKKEMQASKTAKKDILRLMKSKRVGPGCVPS